MFLEFLRSAFWPSEMSGHVKCAVAELAAELTLLIRAWETAAVLVTRGLIPYQTRCLKCCQGKNRIQLPELYEYKSWTAKKTQHV